MPAKAKSKAAAGAKRNVEDADESGSAKKAKGTDGAPRAASDAAPAAAAAANGAAAIEQYEATIRARSQAAAAAQLPPSLLRLAAAGDAKAKERLIDGIKQWNVNHRKKVLKRAAAAAAAAAAKGKGGRGLGLGGRGRKCANMEDDDGEGEDGGSSEEWDADGGYGANSKIAEPIYWADGTVDAAVVRSMDAQFCLLSEHPNKDWHPGSHEQVQNLVHPSLFAFVANVTAGVDPATDPEAAAELQKIVQKLSVKSQVAGQALFAELRHEDLAKKLDHELKAKWDEHQRYAKKRADRKAAGGRRAELSEGESGYESPDMRNNGADGETPHIDNIHQLRSGQFAGRAYEDSAFQWLAAEFEVSSVTGAVRIASRVNNLDQNDFPLLYRDLAHIFEHAVPMVARALGDDDLGPIPLPKAAAKDGSGFDAEEDGSGADKKKAKKKTRPAAAAAGAAAAAKDAKTDEFAPEHTRTLQVIVKAANYVLKPGGEDGYEGSWHVEGMPSEHIACSVIYYYHTDECLKGAGLSFRRIKTRREVEPGSDDDESQDAGAIMRIGTVPTPPGRMLVFANNLQHCVSPITNTSATQVGRRKILCFFVVDPKKRIVSTRHTEPQQSDRMAGHITRTLNTVAASPLPKPLNALIAGYACSGMTLAEADAVRLALMKERKYKTDNQNEMWEREFSYCEH